MPRHGTLVENWKLNREELAWAAGFFDGEGHISSYENTNGRSTKLYRRCNIDVRQCDREVLDRFRQAVGVGRVSGPFGPYGPDSEKKRPNWYFQAAGYRSAVVVVAMLWPFLGSIKRDQAHTALGRYLKGR